MANLNDIGNDPVTGAQITAEPHNENYQNINDEVEQNTNDIVQILIDLASKADSSNVYPLGGIDASDVNNDASGVSGIKVSNALAGLKNLINNIELADSNAGIGLYPFVDNINTNDYVVDYDTLTLMSGLTATLTVANSNTGASTLDITDGNGAKDIKYYDLSGTKQDLTSEEISGTVIIIYDGTDWVLLNRQFVSLFNDLNNEISSKQPLATNNDTAEENQVLASNGDGTATFKNIGNVIPPAPVTDLTVDSFKSASGDEVVLSWTLPEDKEFATIAGARVVYKTGNYPSSITDGTIIEPASSPETITGLITDTQYFFSVFAYDTDGNYSEAEQIAATPEVTLEYGLEWNQTTDSYTRLGAAVGLDVTNKGTDGVKTSNFDSVYPWSDMRLCNLADNGTVNAYYGDAEFAFDGSNGQVMVEIPKFYYKAELDTVSDRIFRRWVSEFQVDASYKVAPSHVVGGVEKDFIYIGAKKAYNNGGILESKSGVAPTVSQTISDFRNQAENRGTGWSLVNAMDIFMVWQFLFPIEYGTFKSQESLGQDWTDESAATNTGSMDSYGEDSYGVVTDGLSSASYRGIENPWGNVRDFVDGFIIKDDGYYLEDDPTNYNDTGSGYTNTGITPITTDGYIDDLEFDSTFDYLGLAKSTNGSSSTYIPDYQYSHDTGEVNIASFGGTWGSGSPAGAFFWFLASVASYSGSGIGARLVYK